MASSLLISPHEMASLVVLNVQKPSGFGGLRPLDPHRGFAPGPHQGPLSGPLDPRPLARELHSLRSLRFAISQISEISMLAGMHLPWA